MSNAAYQKIFSEVCSQDVEDDGLSFPSETIRVERIRDEEAYEGVRIRLEARLGNVRIPLQIDVGFGDAIVPAPEELEFPTLLKAPAPKLKAYPKESVVAEKFEAIVKLGMANSRMKDFYDLWILAQRFEFENATLAAAIQATFETRRTSLPSSLPLAFSADFWQSPNKQTQWKAFLRKSDLNANSSLEETIRIVREFVMPVVEGIAEADRERKTWPSGGPWE
jgi:Nucleotidyl transferase AbiEii toxin, Type IV TA system